MSDELDEAELAEAIELEQAGQLGAAVDVYQRLLTRNPRHAVAQYNLGVVRFGLRDLPGAIAAFTAAIAVDPRDAGSYYNRGVCHRALGDAAGNYRVDGGAMVAIGGDGLAHFARAIDDYSAAIAIDEQPHYLVNRAVARQKLGDDAAAIADLRRAIALGDPRAPRALKGLFGLDA